MKNLVLVLCLFAYSNIIAGEMEDEIEKLDQCIFHLNNAVYSLDLIDAKIQAGATKQSIKSQAQVGLESYYMYLKYCPDNKVEDVKNKLEKYAK